MLCKFDVSKCTSKCEKYSMCAFKECQEQITALSEQIGFLFQSINKLTSTTLNLYKENTVLKEQLNVCIQEVINISKLDSEPNKGAEHAQNT